MQVLRNAMYILFDEIFTALKLIFIAGKDAMINTLEAVTKTIF